MNLTLFSCPLWDTLSVLAASDFSDKELYKLLIRMGVRSAMADLTKEWREKVLVEGVDQGGWCSVGRSVNRFIGCFPWPVHLHGMGWPGDCQLWEYPHCLRFLFSIWRRLFWIIISLGCFEIKQRGYINWSVHQDTGEETSTTHCTTAWIGHRDLPR